LFHPTAGEKINNLIGGLMEHREIQKSFGEERRKIELLKRQTNIEFSNTLHNLT